ncbi:MAG: FAD-dependent oxidoreductase [Candidatus Hodarchaeota archaeon]
MTERVLVIGGGISGIKAAFDLGQLGIETTLIEQSDKLGGIFAYLGKTFPYDDDAGAFLDKHIQALQSLQNVKIHTNAQVKALVKKNNNFDVTLDIKDETINVDAIIIATGFVPFDATRIPSYGYGKYKNVITALELTQMLKKGEINQPSGQNSPRNITFIQCIGSRDKRTNVYCSTFCCTYAVHLAKIIKDLDETINVTIMFMDIRTFSNYEKLFVEARKKGVIFMRGKPSLVFEDSGTQDLVVQIENTFTNEFLYHKTNLVVLSIGAEPSMGSEDLSKMLDLRIDERTGFYITTEKDDISALGHDRIFIVGNASGPKDTQYSLAQASAAAIKAATILGKSFKHS